MGIVRSPAGIILGPSSCAGKGSDVVFRWVPESKYIESRAPHSRASLAYGFAGQSRSPVSPPRIPRNPGARNCSPAKFGSSRGIRAGTGQLVGATGAGTLKFSETPTPGYNCPTAPAAPNYRSQQIVAKCLLAPGDCRRDRWRRHYDATAALPGATAACASLSALAKSMTCRATRSCCALVRPGNMGRETIRAAAFSATGKSPSQ